MIPASASRENRVKSGQDPDIGAVDPGADGHPAPPPAQPGTGVGVLALAHQAGAPGSTGTVGR